MKNIIIISLLLFSTFSLGQSFPEGMAYQAQINGDDGEVLGEATIGVEFSIHYESIEGIVVWEEQHVTTTSTQGHISLTVGEGTSTGAGTLDSFSAIDWSTGIYFLEMSVDKENVGDFVSVITQQLMAVPYAFHAKTTSQTFQLSDMTDVDLSGLNEEDILKWNGTTWVASEPNEVDTALFAFSSDSSLYADTAGYALNLEELTWVDSSGFASYSDTSSYAFTGEHALYSDSAIYADTAGVALTALNNWRLDGNDNTDASSFIGTIDSVDLVFRTNNQERMRIKANGQIGFGVNDPLTDFHVYSSDGALFTGEFGVGSIPVEGAGTRLMFYPKKAAFRSGTVTGALWNDGFIGNYSFATGYNTRASGAYSAAFGINSSATGQGAFAAGEGPIATGSYAIAAGQNPQATGNYSVALGRAPQARAESAISIGYHSDADGVRALSLGNYTYAHGVNSVALGYHAHALHDGSFIYSDASDPIGTVSTTAENQFMVRAAGGSIFYTSSDLSTGVELLPGAGAWSILSDVNRKDNITELDGEVYLQRLADIEVYSWNYISQDSTIRHIGPMAQDFHRFFQIGTDSTVINSGDFDGVNLLLLKQLNQKVSDMSIQSEKIEELEEQLNDLREQREYLEEQLNKLTLLLEEKANEEKEKSELTLEEELR